MCPNCVLNSAAAIGYIGPGLICLLFFALAGYFLYESKRQGEFEGDEEDPKYGVFDDE